ncbi:probable magnesium transporter NIPA9 [Papaver somniferum]|uniref:probable magnesium transporter NIPA9 n=1 Tax=Papaver somniferum TaxID=3469 RepID=UPI000E705A93|nr:probable magnesium transporter NIPA9 [Papaver somniferum]
MLRDLSQDLFLQVYVIQPVSGYGLAIPCISSHFYLWEVMNAIDWVGIVLAGVGITGVGVGGDEQKDSSINDLTDDYHDLLV